MKTEPTIVLDDSHAIVLRYQSLLAYRWKATPSIAAVGHVAPKIVASIDSGSGPVIWCNVVLPDIGLPDGHVRTALADAIRRTESRTGGVVNFVVGTGFNAAAMRAMVTGMVLVLRPRYPVKTVATIREAATLVNQWWPPTTPALSLPDVEALIARVVP